MISLLSKILPYLLLLYFLIRSLGKPIYLLGIPFLMFLRYCIFFENVKIFAVPGRFSADFLFAIWLIIFWIILRIINTSQFSSKSSNFNSKNERKGRRSTLLIRDNKPLRASFKQRYSYLGEGGVGVEDSVPGASCREFECVLFKSVKAGRTESGAARRIMPTATSTSCCNSTLRSFIAAE